jgi:hypothetical protein
MDGLYRYTLSGCRLKTLQSNGRLSGDHTQTTSFRSRRSKRCGQQSLGMIDIEEVVASQRSRTSSLRRTAFEFAHHWLNEPPQVHDFLPLTITSQECSDILVCDSMGGVHDSDAEEA